MTPLNLSKPKTLEEMIAETSTKEHWDERGGAYAFVIIVPVAIGLLMLVARRLDSSCATSDAAWSLVSTGPQATANPSPKVSPAIQRRFSSLMRRRL